MIGSISGAIIISGIPTFQTNIAVAISTGLFSGLFTGIWYAVVHPRINSSNTFDSHGVLGTFLIISVIAAVFINPVSVAVFGN